MAQHLGQIRWIQIQPHQRGVEINILSRREPNSLVLEWIPAMQENEGHIAVARIAQHILKV